MDPKKYLRYIIIMGYTSPLDIQADPKKPVKPDDPFRQEPKYIGSGTFTEQIGSTWFHLSGQIISINDIKLMKPEDVVSFKYNTDADPKMIELQFKDAASGSYVPMRYDGQRIQIFESGTFIDFGESNVFKNLFGSKPEPAKQGNGTLWPIIEVSASGMPVKLARLKVLSENVVTGLDQKEYKLASVKGPLVMKTEIYPLRVTGFRAIVVSKSMKGLLYDSAYIMYDQLTDSEITIFNDALGTKATFLGMPFDAIAVGSSNMAYALSTDSVLTPFNEIMFSRENFMNDPDYVAKFKVLFGSTDTEGRFFMQNKPKPEQYIVKKPENSAYPNVPEGLTDAQWALLSETEREYVIGHGYPELRRLAFRQMTQAPEGYTVDQWRAMSVAERMTALLEKVQYDPVPGIPIDQWNSLSREEKAFVYSFISIGLRTKAFKILVNPEEGYTPETWRLLTVKERVVLNNAAISKKPPAGVTQESWDLLSDIEKDWVHLQIKSGTIGSPQAYVNSLAYAPTGYTQAVWSTLELRIKINILDDIRGRQLRNNTMDSRGNGPKQSTVIRATNQFEQRELPKPDVSMLHTPLPGTFLRQFGPLIIGAMAAFIGYAYYGKNRADFELDSGDQEELKIVETQRKMAVDAQAGSMESIKQYQEGVGGLQAAQAIGSSTQAQEGFLGKAIKEGLGKKISGAISGERADRLADEERVANRNAAERSKEREHELQKELQRATSESERDAIKLRIEEEKQRASLDNAAAERSEAREHELQKENMKASLEEERAALTVAEKAKDREHELQKDLLKSTSEKERDIIKLKIDEAKREERAAELRARGAERIAREIELEKAKGVTAAIRKGSPAAETKIADAPIAVPGLSTAKPDILDDSSSDDEKGAEAYDTSSSSDSD